LTSQDQYVVDPAPPRIVEKAPGQQRNGLFLDPGAPDPEWRQLDQGRGAAPKLNDEQILPVQS
jgi:hypothetical protein